jgi:hypothetical protein
MRGEKRKKDEKKKEYFGTPQIKGKKCRVKPKGGWVYSQIAEHSTRQ